MTKTNLLYVFILLTAFYACKKDQETVNGGTVQPNPTTFQGKGGIYYLGSSDAAINNDAYTNPNLAGVVIRFKWENLETSPNVFNWTYLDGEITKAKANNKKVTVQVLGYPNWVITTLGASAYSYIDKNTYHTTYLDTLKDVITWDNIYLSRVTNLINKLAEKYSADTTVAYFNLIGGQISRGLPDSVITASGPEAFWTAFPYNADTLIT